MSNALASIADGLATSRRTFVAGAALTFVAGLAMTGARFARAAEGDYVREDSEPIAVESPEVPAGTTIDYRYTTTADGELMYNVVVKPAAEGTFPTVMIRSCYAYPYPDSQFAERAESIAASYADYLNDGYAVVFQHCRGVGNSTGLLWIGKNEYNDACDAMQWLREQEFYNGSIYRTGSSYLGMTSLIDASAGHDDLKGIAAYVPIVPLYYCGSRNGFFVPGLMGSWVAGQYQGAMSSGPYEVNFDEGSCRSFPQKDWDKTIFGAEDPTFQEHLHHPFIEDPFWREESAGHEIFESLETLSVPTLLVGGFMDLFPNELLKTWNERIPEENREICACVVSPYGHSSAGPRDPKDWPFDMSGSRYGEISPNLALDWFNHIEKGTPLDFIQEGKIMYFPQRAQNSWYVEDTFTEGENEQTLYLNADRVLAPAAADVQEVTYVYDPYNPAEFTGLHSFFTPWWAELAGSTSLFTPQNQPDFRFDVKSFVSEPLAEDASLKGTISADLCVKSDCEDTCFYLRMYVIHDGVTYAIREDLDSICHQYPDYVPGEEVVLHYDIPQLAWNLATGDQIRVDVSSSCYPMYAPHTNVKGLQCDVEKPVVAHNTLVMGKSSITFHTTDYSGYDVLDPSAL